jgi:hypothetical protein
VAFVELKAASLTYRLGKETTLALLTDASLRLKDNAAAQQYFEKSLTILEAQLPQEARSYEAIGTDYIAMLEIIGEDGKAAALQKRMEKVLAKV